MNLRELHDRKESAKRMLSDLEFVELQEIKKCMFYSYDRGACEEYCDQEEQVSLRNNKDFDPKNECWQCTERKVKKE